MRLASLALLATTVSTLSIAQTRGVAIENIDRTTDACTDFDAYANGKWRADHPMPAIQNTWAIRTITQDDTFGRLRTIAEEDAAKAASLPKGSPGQLTGDFYGACMDDSRINALKLTPLDPVFKSIDAAKDAKAINAQMIQLQQIRVRSEEHTSELQSPC